MLCMIYVRGRLEVQANDAHDSSMQHFNRTVFIATTKKLTTLVAADDSLVVLPVHFPAKGLRSCKVSITHTVGVTTTPPHSTVS